MSTAVELQSVRKSFVLPSGKRIDVLCDLDLIVEPGASVAVYGRSGSGKSTLLNVLGLLDQPTSGFYRLGGRHTDQLGDTELAAVRGRDIGFIFQQFHLLDRRTAWENVAEPLLYGAFDGLRARRERAEHVLQLVGLHDRANSMPHVLSGGEQQRVAIARALVREPRLLLADEPTGSLDTRTGGSVLDLLFDVAQTEDRSLVIVTHDPAIAKRADRVLELQDGRLMDGTRCWVR